MLFGDDAPQALRILVVEDEYILAINLRETLESLGYTVIDITDSGEAAIAKAAELHPNLVLMDIRLRGDMDGIQAANQIWRQLQIPIIFVTGHSDQSTVEKASLTSPFGYILKPIRDKELYVAIQTALSRYEREQFLSTVLQSMGDGVIVVDRQCRVKYLNQVAEALTCCRIDDVKERHITDIANFVDEKTQQPMENPLVLALRQNTAVELGDHALLKTRDGTMLPVVDSVAPLQDSNGETVGAVMVFRDDTQRRLAEDRDLARERAHNLAIRMADMQRLDQLKDDFLATTSHELRTPLSNIKLAICMLQNILNRQGDLSLSKLPDSIAITRYLSILREQCDQELRLVNDLLDMRSLDSDAYPVELDEIQIQDWLQHVAEMFQERAASQHQIMSIHVQPGIPPLISDRQCLTRVVSELLNNACKYTLTDGRIQVSARLVPTPQQSTSSTDSQGGGYSPDVPLLELSFCNSGRGIADEHLARIFDPFYRIPNADPWKYGGTGLGLALVQKLIQRLQGSITARSTPGQTCFKVLLPLRLSKLGRLPDTQMG